MANDLWLLVNPTLQDTVSKDQVSDLINTMFDIAVKLVADVQAQGEERDNTVQNYLDSCQAKRDDAQNKLVDSIQDDDLDKTTFSKIITLNLYTTFGIR